MHIFKVLIYQGLDYWWVETARLECECFITTLAFSNDGSRILTAGDVIQLWSHESESSATAPGRKHLFLDSSSHIFAYLLCKCFYCYLSWLLGEGITFEVGGGNDDFPPSGHEQSAYWNCLWKKRPANPIAYLAFSPDGMLFATAGLNDRLVRVWYQNNCECFRSERIRLDK
jgi:WD40 repeat protein